MANNDVERRLAELLEPLGDRDQRRVLRLMQLVVEAAHRERLAEEDLPPVSDPLPHNFRDLFTAEQLGTRWGVSATQVRTWAKEGVIPAHMARGTGWPTPLGGRLKYMFDPVAAEAAAREYLATRRGRFQLNNNN